AGSGGHSMRHGLRWCALALSAALGASLLGRPAGTARAQQPPAQPSEDEELAPPGRPVYTKRNFPTAFIERPLILPVLMAQPEFVLGITSVPGASGEALTFGLDLGLLERFQVGIAVSFPVNPSVDFGSLLVNLQYALIDLFN